MGHKGKFGHEFLEFEIRPDGLLRYANHSNYRKESMIRKEVILSPLVLGQIMEMIQEAEILREDDRLWPQPDRSGRQELEIITGGVHIRFSTNKIGSLLDVQESEDPEGLKVFYYLVQDLKTLVLSLISVHFKIKPI